MIFGRKIGPAPRRAAAVVTAVALIGGASTLAACGSSDDSGGDTSGTSAAAATTSVDAKARELLPADVADRGTLRVATTLDWPPFTYKDSDGQPTGIDIELIDALGDTLGLEPEITNLAGGAVIPGIQNGKFDVAVSQLVTSPERRAVVDFVEYISNPLGLMVRSADADKIDPTDLCGHTLVATQGTGPYSFGQSYSEKECVAKGKPPIKFDVFGDSGTTILALANGRGEGFLSDAAVGVYMAEESDKGLAMDEGIVPGSETRSGIAYSKQQPELGAALRAALLTLMEDGTYAAILEEYGISDASLTEADVRAQEGN